MKKYNLIQTILTLVIAVVATVIIMRSCDDRIPEENYHVDIEKLKEKHQKSKDSLSKIIADYEVQNDSLHEVDSVLNQKIEKLSTELASSENQLKKRTKEILAMNDQQASILFLDQTGYKAPPEFLIEPGGASFPRDTSLIVPMESIRAANVKFEEHKEFQKRISLLTDRNETLSERFINISEINSNLRSIILTQNNIIVNDSISLIACETLAKDLASKIDEKDKKIKKEKRRFWAAVGAAGLFAIIAVLK